MSKLKILLESSLILFKLYLVFIFKMILNNYNLFYIIRLKNFWLNKL